MNTLQIYDYFDAHTHLEHNYCPGIFAVRSYRAGIEAPNTKCYSIGIHPYDVLNVNCERLDISKLNSTEILAIGEIGLDFRFNETVPQQLIIFKQQLNLARNMALPVVIHCVKAFEQTLAILQKEGAERFMFHGFNSSIQNAQKILNAGGYLSFGSKLLYNSSLQEVFKQVVELNASRILLESDESENVIPQLYGLGTKLYGSISPNFNEQIKQNFITFYNL